MSDTVGEPELIQKRSGYCLCIEMMTVNTSLKAALCSDMNEFMKSGSVIPTS